MEAIEEEMGENIHDEEGNIDKEKLNKLLEREDVKAIVENPKFQDMVNDPKMQELAKEKMKPLTSKESAAQGLDISKISQRAAQLKELGYEPEEVKSIIEQEQQMFR